ncbi:hypothetical protein ACFFKU_06790 [Kineococcus gynurae]|uniref:Uncharacterized protein n=1 Tax=Kineococcus gynurae TaxID=452979 RepID=A0ABV5LX83_9ACTN
MPAAQPARPGRVEVDAETWSTLQWALHATTRLLGTVSVLVGALIALGGAARLAAPAYTVQAQVPAATAVWGGLLILAGILTVVGSLADRVPSGRKLAAAGLLAQALTTAVFGIGFVLAAGQEHPPPGAPHVAPLTGIGTWLGWSVHAATYGLLTTVVRR